MAKITEMMSLWRQIYVWEIFEYIYFLYIIFRILIKFKRPKIIFLFFSQAYF